MLLFNFPTDQVLRLLSLYLTKSLNFPSLQFHFLKPNRSVSQARNFLKNILY